MPQQILYFPIQGRLRAKTTRFGSAILPYSKGHGNEADFLGFCRNWFLIDPLHYLSSHSDLGFKFVEIFVIEKQNPRKSASLPCPFNLSG
jgi:hypothetical protein